MGINISASILLIVASIAPSVFWLFFYFYYSSRFTTPRGILSILFLGGICAAIIAAFFERWVISFLPDDIVGILAQYFSANPLQDPGELAILGLFTFFFIAPAEEFLKFILLAVLITKYPRTINQIIDGIKFGIVAGLGFAVLENGIYFQPFIAAGDAEGFARIFFLRFFVATLGHSLYTGILGYYVGLSRFHRLYRPHLIRNGLVLSVLIHGLFNFFLLVDIGFYSTIIVITSLLFTLKWYRDRKNLEMYLVEGKYEFIRPPLFSERPEFESILSKNQVSYAVIKKLGLCPFCLKKKDPAEELCSYCGARMKREIPRDSQ